MSIAELAPSIRDLPRADKLQLMQMLVVQLAEEDGVPLLTPQAEYPIWTPLNAFDAAATLSEMLEAYKAKQ